MYSRVPSAGDLEITCLVVGRLLRGSGWSTPQQLVQQSYPGECLFSSSTMKENNFFFPYVYSKIHYYKFYVLYKYWFVCSF